MQAGAADQASRLIDQAVEQASRAGDIIRTTREFLKHGNAGQTSIDVAQLSAAVQNLVRAEAVYNRVRLSLHVEAGLPPVLVDAIQIEQVILNLVRNSIDAMIRKDIPRRDITLAATPSADPAPAHEPARFLCSQCGVSSVSWHWRCPGCRGWDTLQANNGPSR